MKTNTVFAIFTIMRTLLAVACLVAMYFLASNNLIGFLGCFAFLVLVFLLGWFTIKTNNTMEQAILKAKYKNALFKLKNKDEPCSSIRAEGNDYARGFADCIKFFESHSDDGGAK